MTKRSLYLSVIIVIIMCVSYFFKLTAINKNTSEKQFGFNIPHIVTIDVSLPKSDLMKYTYVWGERINGALSNSGLHQSSPSSKNAKNVSGYIYKKIGGIPSICMKSNIKYRWEFYGTRYKDGDLMAIFYNPALKQISILPNNKQLDKGLTIEKIMPNEVNVKYNKEVFILKIFSFKER